MARAPGRETQRFGYFECICLFVCCFSRRDSEISCSCLCFCCFSIFSSNISPPPPNAPGPGPLSEDFIDGETAQLDFDVEECVDLWRPLAAGAPHHGEGAGRGRAGRPRPGADRRGCGPCPYLNSGYETCGSPADHAARSCSSAKVSYCTIPGATASRALFGPPLSDCDNACI